MDAKYLDSFGLPVTLEGDAGDSCADYFNILALSNASDDKASMYFSTAPIRHPDASKWYGQPDRCSRDQLIPILCYAAIRGLKTDFVKDVFNAHKKHYLCYAWNTKGNGKMDMPDKASDLTGPEVWGLWLRVFKPFGYTLLLPICDIETLVNALLWRYAHPETNHITRNHMLVSLTQRKQPSVTSRLTDKINNYNDLNAKWKINCEITGEYPTYLLFNEAICA